MEIQDFRVPSLSHSALLWNRNLTLTRSLSNSSLSSDRTSSPYIDFAESELSDNAFDQYWFCRNQTCPAQPGGFRLDVTRR